MMRFVLTLLCLFVLSGCTAVGGGGDLPVTPSGAPTTQSSQPSGAMSTSPSGGVSTSVPSSTTSVGPVGGCEAPTRDMAAWITENLNGGADFPASRAWMVEAGQGVTPGEFWWVVVWERYSDQVVPSGTYRQVYLTNVPSPSKPTGEHWVEVGLVDLDDNPVLSYFRGYWSNVAWSGERLAAGQEAEAKALSCLSD